MSVPVLESIVSQVFLKKILDSGPNFAVFL